MKIQTSIQFNRRASLNKFQLTDKLTGNLRLFIGSVRANKKKVKLERTEIFVFKLLHQHGSFGTLYLLLRALVVLWTDR